MKILIVGNGGREHALAWCCINAAGVSEVLVAPGNAGTAIETKVRNVPVAANDIAGLVRLANAENVSLTIIGPEGPLVMGVVDAFKAAGLRCFGPSKAAAQLEGSKAYCKEFLERHRIPTAAYRTFGRDDFDESWLRVQTPPIVIKASGLAAGKGVVIAASIEEAFTTVQNMFDGAYGEAGETVVIEEFLEGEEASFIVIADGTHALPCASSQDHKRLGDGDVGPNTGGMGAYSPAPVVTAAVHERVMREVIGPTLKGLAHDGTPYTGFLYAGLMIDTQGAPRVIEFNCRFGDPEAQAVLARLRSDLPSLCIAALEGRLAAQRIEWDPRAALGVVLAAEGYPGKPQLGRPLSGLERAAQLPGKVFHAGTEQRGDTIVTSGGRVLCAVGLGAQVAQAQRAAYDLVACIRFPGAQFRHDIGYRAIARDA
ncbi:MAG TPA: phosphoribosylamine--glycine ligase [Steroidobacteraceae bacterium]|nr:phosphoribosylamine--glycine ligase [Steroidobacteraceae bacterium]